MSFQEYLRDQAADGASDGRGSFTLPPDKARKKLAESVPPTLSSPWAGAALLLQALQLWQDSSLPTGSLWPAFDGPRRAGAGFIYVVKFRGKREATLRITGAVPAETALARLREVWEDSCHRPFGSTEPLALCLSRGMVVLARHNVGLHVRFGAADLADLVVEGEGVLPPSESFVSFVGKPKDGEVLIVCGQNPAWLSQFAPPHGGDAGPAFVTENGKIFFSWVGSYPFGQLQEAFRLRALAKVSQINSLIGADSSWTRCPSRESTRLCLNPDSASWYDYRSKKPILLEYLIESEQPGPLPVASDSVREMSGHQVERIGESHSSWQRVTTQCENLILRRWSQPPVGQACGGFFCRAIFSIALTDAPSQALFANWSETLELTPLPGLPPGLAACVWWPELRQSLYGDSWVRDEAYQQALDWTLEQGKKAFAILADDFDYVWSMLEQDHVRRSSRSEVHQRVTGWLRPPTSS